MRKQTKLVAVASAAALLAIGASMTSFAATGWVEEGGEWFYYEKDGSKAEDVWKRSGDKWFWLDSEENGAMAIEKLVEDGENTYFVDSTGAMVSNVWIKLVNEEQDDEDDPAEFVYYYMQNNGKAYKGGDTTKFKTIDGKRFAFDEEGRMLYGWVGADSTRVSGESDWATESAVYYCGNWDDGAMKTGWQKVNVYDEDEDDNIDYWFHFKSNGKRTVKSADDLNFTEKTINGRKYAFDDRGVMVYEWNLATGADGAASASNWKYFSDPEDGARKTKGWFKVIAPDEDSTFGDFTTGFDTSNADDETEKWYYANGDGTLKEGEIARIKGKYYAFAPDKGYMLSGLVFMKTDGEGNIVKVYDDGVDSDELDDLIDGKPYGDNVTAAVLSDSATSLYFFGNDADTDGAMKTGTTTVTLDGNSYNFMFNKTGGADTKGKGVTGLDDDKYIYKYGMRIKAGSDDKYRVVYASGSISDDGATVKKVSSADLRKSDNGMLKDYTNKDGDTVKYNIDGNDYYTDYTDCYLVNTSGSVVSGTKSAAKDGDEWYFYVNDGQLVLYANTKALKPLLDKDGNNDSGTTYDLNNWKNDFKFEKK